jgi:hypothetical protein
MAENGSLAHLLNAVRHGNGQDWFPPLLVVPTERHQERREGARWIRYGDMWWEAWKEAPAGLRALAGAARYESCCDDHEFLKLVERHGGTKCGLDRCACLVRRRAHVVQTLSGLVLIELARVVADYVHEIHATCVICNDTRHMRDDTVALCPSSDPCVRQPRACCKCVCVWFDRSPLFRIRHLAFLCPDFTHAMDQAELRLALQHDESVEGRRRLLRFERIVSRADSHPDTHPCPTSGCPYVGYVTVDLETRDVKCELCNRCWRLPHRQSNAIQPVSEFRTRLWLRWNTRPCPECRAPTQNDENKCTAMECSSCGKRWCWDCRLPIGIPVGCPCRNQDHPWYIEHRPILFWSSERHWNCWYKYHGRNSTIINVAVQSPVLLAAACAFGYGLAALKEYVVG